MSMSKGAEETVGSGALSTALIELGTLPRIGRQGIQKVPGNSAEGSSDRAEMCVCSLRIARRRQG